MDEQELTMRINGVVAALENAEAGVVVHVLASVICAYAGSQDRISANLMNPASGDDLIIDFYATVRSIREQSLTGKTPPPLLRQ